MTRLYTALETSILYCSKNTGASAGDVVGDDIARRRMAMLQEYAYNRIVSDAALWLDSSAGCLGAYDVCGAR